MVKVKQTYRLESGTVDIINQQTPEEKTEFIEKAINFYIANKNKKLEKEASEFIPEEVIL